MIFDSLILFLGSFLAGLSVFLIGKAEPSKFKALLAFSGSYLFSLTVIHILPEAIAESSDFRLTGIFILCGFFLQIILEYFSSGVEHGHLHVHEGDTTLPWSMFISLCLHAFLEGMLLYHPSHLHYPGHSDTLLFGLLLHKIPEAFALMSVLILGMHKKMLGIILLGLFSLASPLGLWVSTWFFNSSLISPDLFVYVFALIAGNFLYISTTIFFESSPNHKFKANRLLMSVAGALAAIAAEFIL